MLVLTMDVSANYSQLSDNMNHNWSGWPGAWCLNCGVGDLLELALADDCPNCKLPYGPEDPNQEFYVCPEHDNGECPGPKDGHNPYVQ